MSDTTKSAKEPSGWYRAARIGAAVLFHTFCPVKYHHAERVNIDAPFIVIANHLSLMDPVIVAVPIKRYDVTFMGKKELAKNPIVRKILLNMHCIMVDRHNTDMEAMRTSMKALRNGEILGIFPEGTRHHTGLMDELETGVAMIALRSGVPVIPMYIPRKLGLFRRADCYVGEPIPMEDLREKGINKETCQELLDRITALYRDMAREAGEK